MWARTLIPIFAMALVVMSAPDSKPVAEEDDDDRPFSIGLGVLAPSYSQKLGKDGKTRLDFHQDDKGFSYTVGNADPKDKNFFKQYQSVQFNKPAPAPQNEIGHQQQKDTGNNQRDLANAAQTYRDTPYGNSAGAYQGYNQGVRGGAGAGAGRGAYGDVATTRNIYAENGVGNDRRTYAGLATIRTPEFDRFFQAGVTNNQVVGAPSQQNNIHGYSRTYNGPAEGVLAFANDPVSPRFASEYASAARPSRHGGGGYGQDGGQGSRVAGGNYGNDFGGILANYGQGGQGVFGGGAEATRQNTYQPGQGGQQGFAFDASGFPPIPGYDPNAPQKAEQNQEQLYNPAPVAQSAPRQAPRQVPVPVYDQGSYGGGYSGGYDQGRQPRGQRYGHDGQGYGQQVAFSNQASYGPRGTYGSVGHIANQPYARAPQFQSLQGGQGQRGQAAGQQNLIGVSFGDAKNPYGGAFNYGGSITHHAGGGAPAQPVAQPQGGHGGQRARA